MNKREILTAIVLAILVGCGMSNGGSIFNKEPFVDAKTDEKGNVILLDTPRMWRDWREVVDMRVANELAKKRPPGGVVSWNAHWLGMIDSNQNRENASKYIAYIIEARRKAGLLELED